MKWFLTIPVAMLAFSSCSTRSDATHDAAAKDGPVKVEVAAKEIDAGIQLLDVRTADEWESGHIEGAKRVTFGEAGLVDRAKVAADPKKPVLVYCRSGGRSAKAAQELRAAGFSQVLELEGGVIAWQKSGKPLVKGR